MTVAGWLATAALCAVLVLAIALVRTRIRLARLVATTRALDELVRRDLEPRVAAARADARAADATARDAAIAAGVGPAPLRLPLEPVTGPVVRAVAFSASARRTLARVATATLAPRREARRSA